MTNPTWKWADLSPEQQRLLSDAERALGADYLLAFEPMNAPRGPGEPVRGIEAAPLSDSELECLSGLESQLRSVVVAYRRREP